MGNGELWLIGLAGEKWAYAGQETATREGATSAAIIMGQLGEVMRVAREVGVVLAHPRALSVSHRHVCKIMSAPTLQICARWVACEVC